MVPRIAIVGAAGRRPRSTRRSTPSSTRATAGSRSTSESIDEIVGILYAKDLLPFLKAGTTARARRSGRCSGTPVFVPESMSVDDLLHEFQRRKVHIAIVLDEYGGTAGLVTIEDLLEEIVGEIQDEYDEEEPMVVRLSDDEARVDGRAAVDDLRELFDTTSASRTRTSTTRSAGSSTTASAASRQAGRRGRRRRPAADRRVDRRPAGRQGARRPRADDTADERAEPRRPHARRRRRPLGRLSRVSLTLAQRALPTPAGPSSAEPLAISEPSRGAFSILLALCEQFRRRTRS